MEVVMIRYGDKRILLEMTPRCFACIAEIALGVLNYQRFGCLTCLGPRSKRNLKGKLRLDYGER
jgi:hypothetical protein